MTEEEKHDECFQQQNSGPVFCVLSVFCVLCSVFCSLYSVLCVTRIECSAIHSAIRERARMEIAVASPMMRLLLHLMRNFLLPVSVAHAVARVGTFATPSGMTELVSAEMTANFRMVLIISLLFVTYAL